MQQADLSHKVILHLASVRGAKQNTDRICDTKKLITQTYIIYITKYIYYEQGHVYRLFLA